MDLSSIKTRIVLLIGGLLAFIYTYGLPYLKETGRINSQAIKIQKELTGLKQRAADYGANWDKEMSAKEKKIREQLPDTVNSAANLDYLVKEFEKENPKKVNFISASYQASTASEFKIKEKKETISPRVSRYKIRTQMEQERVIPYLEHLERFATLHHLENVGVNLTKSGDFPLEMEVVIAAYLAPKNWVTEEVLTAEDKNSVPVDPNQWQNWFQEGATTAKKSREISQVNPDAGVIRFKIQQLMGNGIVVDENLYEEGDWVKGWRVLKVDNLKRSVILQQGDIKRRVSIP